MYSQIILTMAQVEATLEPQYTLWTEQQHCQEMPCRLILRSKEEEKVSTVLSYSCDYV